MHLDSSFLFVQQTWQCYDKAQAGLQAACTRVEGHEQGNNVVLTRLYTEH
jgi:hypothetical protein